VPKLKDGLVKRGSTWSYVIRVPDPTTGRSRPLWVGGYPTESAAKIARDEARYLARRGELVERSQVTLEAYLIRWLDEHAMTVKAKTISGYREALTGYVVPRIGRIKLQSIQPATLTTLYRELAISGGREGRPLSPGTIRQVHRALRKALNDAVENDRLIPNNPALRTKIPRLKPSTPGQVWTMAHLRIFLASIRTHRLYAFFHLAAYTGARRGELLALRWSEVNLRKGTVTLKASTDVIDRERVTDTPKSGRSRTIAIDPQTVALLGEHRRQQDEERDRLGAAYMDADDYVFTREDGQQLYPSTVTQLMSRFIRDHNEPHQPGRRGHPRETLPPPEILLPPARLHDLRHLHATTLLRAGEAVHVVSNRLGHADPAITLRVYAHVINESSPLPAMAFAEAVARLDHEDDADDVDNADRDE
jgi:integrase